MFGQNERFQIRSRNSVEPAQSKLVSQMNQTQHNAQPIDAEKEIKRLRQELDRMKVAANSNNTE